MERIDVDPDENSGTRRTSRRRPGRRRRGLTVCAVAVAVVTGGGTAVLAAGGGQPGPQGDGTAVTPTGWRVTPAGRQSRLGERPYGLARSADGRWLLASNDGVGTQSVVLVEAATGRVASTLTYPAPKAVFLGAVFSPDGTRAYVSGGANDLVRVYRVAGGALTELAPLRLATAGTSHVSFAAGLTLSRDGRTLYVANNLTNVVSVIDTGTGREKRIALDPAACVLNDFGSDPSNGKACLFAYTVTLSRDGATAYVSNVGQDFLSVIDTTTATLRGRVEVGTHPSGMVASPVRDELYVANTDGDSISVVDTRTSRVLRSFSLSPYPRARVGTQPNALAVSPDGRTLYTANAGNNDVDVVRLADQAHADLGGRAETAGDAARDGETDRVAGLIPTGWYPTGIALSPDGSRLYVANGKGLGAGPNPGGPVPGESGTPDDQYIGSMIQGTLSTIRVPGPDQLGAYTRQVSRNNGFAQGDAVRLQAVDQHVVPRRADQGSKAITHVIYVVNENRTYDQVLGDLGKGNGDPSLTLFDRRSTPNHHALAEQFTTLDNLYAGGEVSDDGWEWTTGANASSLNVKTQPTLYGGRGHFYTGEGGTLGAAPGTDPTQSYLWDRLTQKGLSFRNYGFWATDKVPVSVYNEPNLMANTDTAYPGFNMAISDQDRYAEWLREFRGYERKGVLPSVEFLKFPRDHTCGTSPSCPSPRAMVADSDYALGQLVDTVSHSTFWDSTAIFVIEDDAQDGPDHVDAHRTVGHVISPYTQRGTVDSTLYSSVSMLRTMELILGVQPLTQFDASANPMVNSFTDTPVLKGYRARVPAQSLTEPNAPSAPMAALSAHLDLSREDRAPADLLNQAIWQSVKGAGSRMPAPVHAGPTP